MPYDNLVEKKAKGVIVVSEQSWFDYFRHCLDRGNIEGDGNSEGIRGPQGRETNARYVAMAIELIEGIGGAEVRYHTDRDLFVVKQKDPDYETSPNPLNPDPKVIKFIPLGESTETRNFDPTLSLDQVLDELAPICAFYRRAGLGTPRDASLSPSTLVVAK